MNKYFILFLLFLTALLFLGDIILKDVGYVLISFHHYALETSVWILVITVLFVLIILHACSNIIGQLIGLKSVFSQWREGKQSKQTKNKVLEGTLLALDQEWDKAEKCLKQGLKSSDYEALSLLGLAQIAHTNGDITQRETYLKSLKALTELKGNNTIELMHAEFLIQNQQWEQALTTLETLQKQNSKNPKALQLLLKIYIHQKAWSMGLQLLTQMQKLKTIDPSEYLKQQKAFYSQILAHKAYTYSTSTEKKSASEQLYEIWIQLPKTICLDSQFVSKQIALFKHYNLHYLIQKILEASLKKKADPDWILSYGYMDIKDPNLLINFLEKEAKLLSTLAEYHLVLGYLYGRLAQWNTAQDFYHKSLSIQPLQQCFYEMAQMHIARNELKQSIECYKKALQLHNPHLLH